MSEVVCDLLRNDTMHGVLIGVIVSWIFYRLSSRDFDERMRVLDRLIGNVEFVIRDPENVTLNRDESGRPTVGVTVKETAGLDVVKVKTTGTDALLGPPSQERIDEPGTEVD